MTGSSTRRDTHRRHRRRAPHTRLAALTLAALALAACDSSSSTTEPTGTSATDPTATHTGGTVRISEVHYHSPLDDPTVEFVEVTNIGDEPVLVQDWCLQGTQYCFSGGTTIAPGEFVVVHQSDIDGTLSNDDDDITLVDHVGAVVDHVAYTDTDPWPTEADGGGLSLQRRDFTLDGTDPAAWTAGVPTPGAAYDDTLTYPPGDVVITEINYHPADDNPAARYVELLNTTASPIDLTGWCLVGVGYCIGATPGATPDATPDDGTPTAIAANATTIVVGVFDDRLSSSHDRIRIVDPTGRVHDTVVYTDSGQWPALADGDGMSLHRRNTAQSGADPGNWDVAPPSPGVVTADDTAALLPTFGDVAFTIAPDATTPITVTAHVTHADAVALAYVIGFDAEVTIAVTPTPDGALTAQIPAQPAGTLVRFRLIGTSGPADASTVGTWPRNGDGAHYEGTVVADPAASDTSALERLQLFMPPDVYKAAYRDTSLQGNDGYPVVIAHNGVVFDNAIIRVKGNQARSNSKRKWKVMLPAGHEWTGDGTITGNIEAGIDQFDLLPAATDKSFSREILVSDMQTLSGGISQQVFPMRIELNNEFYGLYMYGESPDGGWRTRQGLSDQTYVWKVDGITKMRMSDINVDDAAFAKKYERITNTYLDDHDQLLRDFVTTLNTLTGDDLIRYAYEHIDIPQVVEALATMRIVQHAEWQHKNYYVMYDPTDERWRLVPIDFDLTFGRYYGGACKALCDDLSTSAYTDYPNQNKFAKVLLENEPFRSMVDRRTRTLAEQYLAPGWLENRLAELLWTMGPDSELDRARWKQYGTTQSMDEAQAFMTEWFIIQKRHLYLDSDEFIPGPQPAAPELVVAAVVADDGTVVGITIVNHEAVAIDLSGRTFPDVAPDLGPIRAGTVIPANATLTIDA